MKLLTTLVLCRLHGMMESWNNGQKRIIKDAIDTLELSRKVLKYKQLEKLRKRLIQNLIDVEQAR